ncbi:protein abnormal spindle [Toxorhynchites rutilus septentrionalis]|uniref:protein abnormal spindle n=1 Tax=Toxorhynchites rutilus septentrionalis TaxID=329112 RepID=UPI00247AD1B7|nr:protein abnormal spindle [Toxorhynchites rutilus septentrionalis]
MSAFEVNVTPTRGQPKRRTESREPTLVFLGPFTPKATVIFEGVPVGKTARRQLIVKNPYDGEIKVLVTKIPKPDFNLALEWTSLDIPFGEERQLELVWNPLQLLIGKECLQLSDSRGNKKEVTLILKSMELKKASNKKQLSKPVLPKKLKLKSPSPPKILLKRAVLKKKRDSPSRSITQSSPSVHPASPVNVLRPSHASNIFSASAFNFSHVSEAADYDRRNNKENVSPGTPENASRLFNGIKFTPTSHSKDISYLADLPTPINFLKLDDIRLERTTTIRKRLSISPEITQRQLPSYENETPRITISHDHSALALKRTPKSSHSTTIHRTLNASESKNMFCVSKEFDPNCFSTVTKPERQENVHQTVDEATKDSGRQLNFSHEYVLNDIQTKEFPVGDKKSTRNNVAGSISPCNEIQLVLMNALDTAYGEQPKVLNKTQTVSPYSLSPQLSMIAEESSRDLGATYHGCTSRDQTPDPLQLNQKTFKVASHDSLLKCNSADHIGENLTMEIKHAATQASMPNLNDGGDFFDEEEARMFKEHEIRAQSSRFNLHEIGHGHDESRPDGGKSLDRSSISCDKDELFSMQISPPKRSKLSMSASLNSLLSVASTGPTSHFAVPTAPRNRLSSSNARISSQTTRNNVPRTLSLKRPPVTTPPGKKFPSAEKRVFLYDSERHLKTLINPDPFAATTTCDPFLSATMYLDERAFQKYERQLKKWLNALVTIPADLDTEPNKPLDVGKLFDEVKGKDLTLAPTKELISSNYYKSRLNQLRSAGIALYLSKDVADPLRKVRSSIEKKAMALRTDRDLHLDLVLQRNILELLLCFNPLWLRLGLEVTYGEEIELQSNRDVIGLSTFIVNRLFRDRYLESKNSRAYSLSPAYGEHMKKYTFRMFLFLLFFLDTAKNRRLIKHNPCLFVRNAPYKETREILVRFSSHLIAGIGDITKHLRRFGYTLTHKQTFLDEFNYAFENLAVDLRDGIRLTRVMEIILLRDDLTNHLRVPSISRLQKIHNVNLALKALEEAQYQITGDIAAKDICDGHREKTLSLMWQIVYKFRAPKFNAAANVIRSWWKKKWLKVFISRRIAEKKRKRMELAALRIQTAFRGYYTRKYYHRMREQKLRAIVVMQKYTRRYLAQKRAAMKYSYILRIQHWWHAVQQKRAARKHFLLQRTSAIVIQKRYRRHVLANRLLAASAVIRTIKAESRRRHQMAIVIQRALRSYAIHRKLQSIVMGMVAFNQKKALKYRSAAKIQATFKMYLLRRKFVQMRASAIRIQIRWREYLLAKKERNNFLNIKRSALVLQARIRGYFLMMQAKTQYEKQRSSILYVQRKFLATRLMRKKRAEYLQLKQTTIMIQRTFRAQVAMRVQRDSFLRLKSAAMVLQQRYRAKKAMQACKREFTTLRNAAVTIQCQLRAQLAMREARNEYQLVRSSCIFIQRRFRETVLMKKQRLEFLTLQYHTIFIQRQFRANLMAQQQRQQYLELRSAVTYIQNKLRATILMRQIQSSYQQKRDSAIKIQQCWRYAQLKRTVRSGYQEKKMAAIKIQRFYRGHLLTKKFRSYFIQLRKATISIQLRYRATKLMQTEQKSFKNLMRAVVTVQKRYQAILVARRQKTEYVELRKAVINIQQRWRAKLCMRRERNEYLQLRSAAIRVQCQFRATRAKNKVQADYQNTRNAIIFIQRKYRAKCEMERVYGRFLNLKSATIVIQEFFRGYLRMKQEKATFQQLKSATCVIQRRFRALKSMKAHQADYNEKRTAALVIQHYFRAHLQMKQQRNTFVLLKKATLIIQTRYRATLAMRIARREYESMVSSVVLLQRKWRATLRMHGQRKAYQNILSAVKIIQVRFRAHKLRQINHSRFLTYRNAVITVQRRFRANCLMRSERAVFQQLQTITLRLQALARGFLARAAFTARLTPEYIERRHQEEAAKRIQASWRGYKHRKRHQTRGMREIANRMAASRRESARDPSNRVHSIVRSCMKFMKTRFAVHEAIKVLLRIEHISRLVPYMLENDADFLATFCYGTMAQAIRSELDKQLIEICARIILNMARFGGTKEEVFQENGLVTVSQMLLRWCDKECGIFNTLCTLLWVLSHDVRKKNAIRRYMISREAIYMLRETKKLVKRKENMRKNVKKPIGCLVPPDPSLMRMEPILEPDYGVIRSKPYVFYSSVFAFDTVLSRLNVDIS